MTTDGFFGLEPEEEQGCQVASVMDKNFLVFHHL
jgi:hypothetical protein